MNNIFMLKCCCEFSIYLRLLFNIYDDFRLKKVTMDLIMLVNAIRVLLIARKSNSLNFLWCH